MNEAESPSSSITPSRSNVKTLLTHCTPSPACLFSHLTGNRFLWKDWSEFDLSLEITLVRHRIVTQNVVLFLAGALC